MATHRRRRFIAVVALGVAFGLFAGCRGEAGDGAAAGADVVRVAVAANFSAAFEELARDFTAETAIAVRTSVGATGQLYAQIRNGAPYDVFLSADAARPRRLEAEGMAVPGSRTVYAEGRLAVYAPRLAPLPPDPLTLFDGPAIVVAWANERTAPYGAAARAVLEARGRGEVQGARGESVGQVLQFVESGAADIGFVALSQVVGRPSDTWALVPAELHPPLVQEAVILHPGAEHTAAERLVEFLASDRARKTLARRGYEPPRPPPSDSLVIRRP